MKRAGIILIAFLVAALTSGGKRFIPWATPSGGGGGSYLVNEDFEGTGTPTDFSGSYMPSGTYDWHYTTSPLTGSKSFHDNSSSNYPGVTFSAQSDLWIYFTWKGTLSGYDEMMQIYVGGTFVAYLKHLAGGQVQLGELGGSYNTANSASGALADSTKTHFWIHRTSSGALDFYIGSSGTRSSATHHTVSGGSVTGAADSINWRYAAGAAFWLDDVKVAAVELYDNGATSP